MACALLGLDADGLWANKTTFGSMLETFGLQDDAKPSTISSNMSPSEQFEQLFSYGSLQDKSVQLRTFDRTLAGTPDVLTGYRAVKIEIRDRTVAVASGAEYYLNAQFVGDASECVAGTRFDVTKQELERADVYEASANYRRVRVQLKSGVQSWIYVSAALAER
ncbi:MAG: gamma-glutamylcyclotransferase family protein [Gemmatimonas sp.]